MEGCALEVVSWRWYSNESNRKTPGSWGNADEAGKFFYMNAPGGQIAWTRRWSFSIWMHLSFFNSVHLAPALPEQTCQAGSPAGRHTALRGAAA